MNTMTYRITKASFILSLLVSATMYADYGMQNNDESGIFAKTGISTKPTIELGNGVILLSPNERTGGILEGLPLAPWTVSAVTGTTVGWYLAKSGLAESFVQNITSGNPVAVASAGATAMITLYLANGAKQVRETMLPAKYNTKSVANQCLAIATLAGLVAIFANSK